MLKAFWIKKSKSNSEKWLKSSTKNADKKNVIWNLSTGQICIKLQNKGNRDYVKIDVCKENIKLPCFTHL